MAVVGRLILPCRSDWGNSRSPLSPNCRCVNSSSQTHHT
uniref:Uncharacterized protein n=1 Tax=Arundo donax TaxID=35708 RepID=A0A0A8Y6K7_ARUDO